MAHDVLADALARGVTDWEADSLRWRLHGALRRRAAFLARTAARRQAREERHVWPNLAEESRDAELERGGVPCGALPPSLRSVAVLLVAGMSRREICSVLGMSDVALRQRLTQLRKRGPLSADGSLPDTGLAWGRLRRALRQAHLRDPGLALGAHDPDGHLLLFRRARG